MPCPPNAPPAFRAEFGDAGVRIEAGAEPAAAHRLDLRAANIALAERLGFGRGLERGSLHRLLARAGFVSPTGA